MSSWKTYSPHGPIEQLKQSDQPLVGGGVAEPHLLDVGVEAGSWDLTPQLWMDIEAGGGPSPSLERGEDG